MSGKSKSTRRKWRGPDDAPEITQEWVDSANLYHGEKLVRRGRPRVRLTMQQLSVNRSRLVSHVLPIGAVIAACAYVYWNSKDRGSWSSMIWALVWCAVAIGILVTKLRKGLWAMADSVEELGDNLRIVHAGKERLVPLSEISEVLVRKQLAGSEVILKLRAPGEAGTEIRFLAPDKRRVPLIDERLRALVDRVQSQRAQDET
jgi:hypothetical protein